METNEILAEADRTLTELIGLLSEFRPKQVNTVPWNGSWSAGQLAEHMILANGGFVQMIFGPVEDTLRNPCEMILKIKADFLNFDIRMTSPPFIAPALINYDKERLLTDIRDIRGKAIDAIKTLDLTKTCTAFALPVYGYLTRLEACYFIIYHTQRHIRQLKDIYQAIHQSVENS